MTVVLPALPGRACNKCLRESYEFTCLLLAWADMRVDLARRSLVGDFGHGGHDTAPGSCAIVIAGECQFVNAAADDGEDVTNGLRISRAGTRADA
jgi:hypothetical protein